jgi:hypothetical protein
MRTSLLGEANGKEYREGETWIEGCKSCRCPAEGSKAAWCSTRTCDAGAAPDAREDVTEGGAAE